jgi:ubiquinone/menaquinone biosynthesis C-methylase UbiE
MVCRYALSSFLAIAAFAQAPAAVDQRERWNKVFTNPEARINREANAFLQKTVEGRKPGKALDVGIGMGRNSLWLASKGWEVTGIDISDAGIKLAQDAARKQGLKLNTVLVSADDFDYGTDQYDLVIGMFMHQIFSRNSAKVVKALKPGGMVVVEAYHADTSKLVQRPLGYGNNELLRAFDALRIRFYEELTTNADYSPDQAAPIVRMIAIRE